MPENIGELAWWAFNGLFLIMIAWGKMDLTEIKRDTKEAKTLNEQNSREISVLKAECVQKHLHLNCIIELLAKQLNDNGGPHGKDRLCNEAVARFVQPAP